MPPSPTTVRQGRNLALTIAIVRDGRTRWRVADAANVSPSLLSGCITGRVVPSDATKARVSAALNASVDDLFGPDAYEGES